MFEINFIFRYFPVREIALQTSRLETGPSLFLALPGIFAALLEFP